MDDKGISALIGILLLLGILVIFAGIMQSSYVPEWNKEIEAEHFNSIYDDMVDIRQAIERTASYELSQTIIVHASPDYPTRMFLQNPTRTGKTISIYNDKKIWISDNGTNIKENICTIHIKENYNYFSAPELIIEHGMIIGKVGENNYTIDNPFKNNESIDFYVVKCSNNSIGITSSINLHLFPAEDISTINPDITFTTDYPELWVKYLESINLTNWRSGNNITLNSSNSTRIRINITRMDTPRSNSSLIPFSRTCTDNPEFEEGIFSNVIDNYNGTIDQLQINTSNGSGLNYHFIWIPNTNLGTISKVDTRTGNEVGRFSVNSNPSHGGDPSRITVDLKGDVWVGTRRAGTVVKIGDNESGNCIDRNGDGAITTSRDANNDGNITDTELLGWGNDECVLYEVVLISGKEGTFVPGTYPGTYDTNFVGTAPRGLAIDANNNLWAGTYSTKKYFYIDGATGQIKKNISLSPWGHSAYGAVIDKNGILWSSNLRDHILRINTSDLTDIKKISINNTYGFCLDYSGHLFTAGFFTSGKSRLVKYDISGTNPVFMWDIPARTYRGAVSTLDNNIWVAGIDKNGSGNYTSVSRYDNNGNLIKTISGFNQPSGVAVEENGKIWVTDIASSRIYRIDPENNTVDLTREIIDSYGHYTYSDMTGYIVSTITTKIGTWTVLSDADNENTRWGTISWNSSEPPRTSIKVSVRSLADEETWSPWKDVENGIPLNPWLVGRYLEIKTTFQIQSGDTSPILYDLTVSSAS